jgi:DNA-binding transcriptional ArsR family regulator
MTTPSIASPRLEAILLRVKNPTLLSADLWAAECPAHNDEHNFSLSITQRGERVELICVQGCSPKKILEELGLDQNSAPGDCPGKLAPSEQLPGCAVPAPKRCSPGITELRENLSKWLSIPVEDTDLVDFCLAVYKSNELPGDPLWGIVIDASGAGKTELLRAFINRPDAYFLSKLSEKTLVSGYRDPDKPDVDLSLLPKLDGKVLVIKDLAPLLSMRRESRNAIIADLRDAYDGFTDQGLGNLGKVSYKSRFSLLAASTLAIERADTMDQELGERFIKFRARAESGIDKVRKAIGNIGADDSMRNDIEGAITRFLDSLPKATGCVIPRGLRENLVALADFTAKTRSSVARDRNGTLQYRPKPEVGTRLGKELGKLLLALAAVRQKSEPDIVDFATVRRVGEDCLPPNRLAVISALRRGPRRMSEIARSTGLPHATVSRTIDDLEVLGIVERVKATEFSDAWSLVCDWK